MPTIDITARKKSLLLLRATGAIGAFGNGLTGVVLPVALALHLSTTGTGIALFGLSLGMLCSFASGGISADRYDRVKILKLSDISRALANLLVIAGLLSTSTTGIFLAFLGCLCNGYCAGFFRPASASLWASVVPHQKLKNILASNAVINRVCLAAGGSLGGLLLAWEFSVYGLLVDALTFLITALLISIFGRCIDLGSAVNHNLSEQRASTFSRLFACLHVINQWSQLLQITRRYRWLHLWTWCNICSSLLNGLISVALPLSLVELYSSEEIGVFQSVSVIAVLIGSVLARIVLNIVFPGIIQAFGSLATAASYLFVGLGFNMMAATLLRGTGYVGASLVQPSFAEFVTTGFSDEYRGKVFAIQQGVSSVLSPVGMLLAILAQLLLSPVTVVIVSSIGLAFLGVIPLLQRGYWTFSTKTSTPN